VGTGDNIHARLYVNEQGKLVERATELGVGYPLARGRSPLWLDFNRDGLIDLVFGVEKRRDAIERPAIVFQQKPDHTFVDASAVTGFKLTAATDMICAGLSRDGNLNLITDNSGKLTVYDVSKTPFQDITAAILPEAIKTGVDAVSADFNGDLQPDLFLSQGDSIFFWGCSGNDFYQNNPNKLTLKLALGAGKAQEKGLQFQSPGELTINIAAPWDRLSLNEIYLGGKGSNPPAMTFTLSPTNEDLAGVYPHQPGTDAGVYISYEAATNRWQILSSKREAVAFIESSKPITGAAAIGFQAECGKPAKCNDLLLINSAKGLVDKSVESGIRSPLRRSVGVTAGDFDNDMDVDLYIVTTGIAVNTPNVLLLNRGDGTFVAAPAAAGAAGTELGNADFVISADYDQDGYLDFLVANGLGNPDPMINQGPYQLYHNESRKAGNRNHWLEIDLQGARSNRDGIGAQVFVTAGGKTQLREQNNGVHFRVQDFRRLHFGLGTNAVAQELLIKWPSGTQQRIKDVKADQVLKVVESGGS
jgi:hypothetical protein